MPIKLKNDEGKEVEVMTQEEIDALIEKTKTEATSELSKELDTLKKDIESKTKELTTLTTELESAKEALDKSDQGTKDWSEARKQIKTLEKQIESITKERTADKEQFAKDLREVRTSTFKASIESWKDNLAGDNKEVRDKIEFYYNRLGAEVKDEKEAQEIMKDAYLLATGKQAPNMFNVARGSFVGQPPKSKEPMSQEVSELGKKFGISDEDIIKYSQKAAEKKSN